MKYLLLCMSFVFLQQSGMGQSVNSNEHYRFRDSIYQFVFDSLSNDMGLVEPVNINNRFTKHFIYYGDTPIIITGQKSGDPHFICDYPREPIVKGKTYAFTVCFYHQNGKGFFNKTMLLELSDGRSIYFKFKGKYKVL